jgi:CO/xanthine dehydrogenase Mo-binding subunit
MHQTGGSASTKEAYKPLRSAAAAREMLVAAAAGWWKVSPSECKTQNGHVLHPPTNRSFDYSEITLLAARQPVPENPKLKEPKDFTLIGKAPGKRVDAKSKVDGTAKFGIDFEVPNMLRAAIVHGPVYGAKPLKYDPAVAKSRPGVIDVFSIDAGVVVVAQKYWQAAAGARELQITWTAGDVAHLDTDELRESIRGYKDDGESVREDGNAKKAIGKAPTQVSAEYEFPYLAHAPMEPQNCIADVREDRAEIWAPCQSPSVTQSFVADAVGLKQEQVLVHTTLAGGGFGRRILADYASQAAKISQHIKRPVQLIWTRESDMTGAFYRPMGAAKMHGGVSADGKVAVSAHIMSQPIGLDSFELMEALMPGIPGGVRNAFIKSLLGMFGSNTVPDLFSAEGVRDTPYKFSDIAVTYTPLRTKLPVASWRSVGHSYTGFVMESFIDELAVAAKKDPVEFRRGILPPDSRSRRVLDAVADLAKWGSPLPPGMGRGIARHESFESEVAEVAEIEIVNGRIKVRRVYAVVDCGIAVNPDIVKAQVEGAIVFGLSAALDQEITVKNGVVQQTNYDTFPPIRMHECPEIIVKILDSSKDPTGIGEPGLPPIGPAVANAVFARTGIRLRKLPLQRAYDEVKQ